MTPFAETYKASLNGQPVSEAAMILAELIGQWMQGRDNYQQELSKRITKLEMKGIAE